jgi:hypothetical protein
MQKLINFTRNPGLLAGLCAALLPLLPDKAMGVFPIADQAGVLQMCGGLAYDGTNYLAALVVGQYGASAQVGAQFISPTGSLSGSMINVGSGLVWPPPWPNVVFGGGTYLEVWSDGNLTNGVDMFGQRISTAGAMVGSSFPLLSSAGSHGFQTVSALVCGGTNFLVVWKDGADNNFYGQMVTTGGSLTGSEFLISGQPDKYRWVAAASDGTNYLVVWQSTNNADMGVTYGEFISSSGSAGSPFQINQTDSLDAYNPVAVAFDGTNYLAVWSTDTLEDAHGNGVDFTLYGRLVPPSGVLSANEVALAGDPGSTDYNDQCYPNLAFDGQDYLLVWTPFAAGGLTNANELDGQFLDRTVSPVGPVFAALPSMGTNRPVATFNGLIYDGARFVLEGPYGLLTPDAAGDFGGIASWQTWGVFISTNPPAPALAFGFETNADNTVTITNYDGSGGAVSIPTNINGLAVASIGEYAFYGISSLTSITIPGSVTNIGAEAFYFCSGLTNATISSGVTSIESNAFSDCTSLASITIPGSVTSISAGAFAFCFDLTNAVIDTGVTSIGDYAFDNCGRLTSITIPDGVTNLGGGS